MKLSVFFLLLAAAAPLAARQPPAAPPANFYQQDEDAKPRDPESTVAEGRGVVSAADPRAAAAGVRMMQQGGNAADAIAATMIALTVVEPQSSGLGGGGYLVWYDAKSGKTYSIDAREKAPAAARPDRFLNPDGAPMAFMDAVAGGYSVGVPGAVALAAELHRRWGSLPWAKLFEPAIEAAREGYPISPRMARMIAGKQALLVRSPAAAAIFLDRDGRPWPAGHILKQPELARTMEMLAKNGPDAFYRGAIGAAVTRSVANAFHHPAALTAADLAAYRAVERTPICRPYRQWKICSMAPSSSGGIGVLQILGQLERFDLKKLGPDNLLSWHLIAESEKLAYADRDAYAGDADFVPVPVQGLISDSYIRERSALIRMDRAMTDVKAGTPPGAGARTAGRLADIPATSHMAAADAEGNVATLTSTIEGVFGSGLMAAGFMLNNQLTDFGFVPKDEQGEDAYNRVQPGKRPRSAMSPTIVYDAGGRPIAAFGAAGGATILSQVAKAIIARLDWNMPVEQAIAAPQVIANAETVLLEKGTRLEAMAAGFQALGHRNVKVATLPLKGNGLERDGDMWRAAGDPRSDGKGAAFEPAPEKVAVGGR